MEIEALCLEWKRAKEVEQQAIEERRNIEARLIELLGRPKDGKESQSHKFDFGTASVKCGYSYRADIERLRAIAGTAFLKPTLDTTKIKKLKLEDPGMYRHISPALTVTPTRESVTIKFNEKE